MESVLLVIHFIVTFALIGLVLLQKSEGGGLGIGGGGGMGSLAGAHTTASVLTKATTLFAVMFFVTNLTLAYIAKTRSAPSTVFETLVEGEEVPLNNGQAEEDVIDGQAEEATADDKVEDKAAPAAPSAPIAE